MDTRSPAGQIMGSTVAGISSTVLGHPLDSIKTHLQTNPRFQSPYDVLRELRWGVFRGMMPPLVNAIVMNTVMFSVFDKTNQWCQDVLLAGLVSGFATAMISTPTDYVKIQNQLHGQSTRQVLQSIPLPRIPALYRGHLANLAREGVFTMAYLGLYHKLGRWRPDHEERSLSYVALTSSTTGAIAWISSYPFDTIKTKIQSDKSLTYRSIWTATSFSKLYRGCGTSTGRAMLVTSSRMVAYEWVLSNLRQQQHR